MTTIPSTALSPSDALEQLQTYRKNLETIDLSCFEAIPTAAMSALILARNIRNLTEIISSNPLALDAKMHRELIQIKALSVKIIQSTRIILSYTFTQLINKTRLRLNTNSTPNETVAATMLCATGGYLINDDVPCESAQEIATLTLLAASVNSLFLKLRRMGVSPEVFGGKLITALSKNDSQF